MRAFLLLTLLLLGCERSKPTSDFRHSPCLQRIFEGDRFTVCNPNEGRLLLIAAGVNEQPLRSFTSLQSKIDTSKVEFAMNAGMFGTDGRPIGLAIVSGRQVHPINLRDGGGNFHLKPNGVFMVRQGHASILQSEDFVSRDHATLDLATQSGPLLVINGRLHPMISPDGSSRFIRNGVGVRDGKALFVISDDPVSFGKLARFFRDILRTPDALYFDGAVSSLWSPADSRQDSHSELGPMIVALRPEGSAPDRGDPAKP